MINERRSKAEDWVNGYTATAVGLVIATAPIPGAATAALCALEATMCYQIGRIYNTEWTVSEGKAVASAIGLAAFLGKIAALEAAILLGPGAFIIKPIIAGTIVKAMGQVVIKHFEDCDSLLAPAQLPHHSVSSRDQTGLTTDH